MRIRRFTFKKVLIFSLSTLLLLAIAEAVVVFHVNKINSQTIEVIQEKNPKRIKLNTVYLKSKLFSNGQNEKNKEAFIECKLINNSNTDFTNWKIEVSLVGNAQFLGCWNVNAMKINDKIIITPESNESQIIKRHSIFTFEVYLNYDDNADYNQIKITGNKIHKLAEYPIHVVISIIAGVILVSLLASAIVLRYMQREIKILNRVTERSNIIIEQTMKTFVNFIDAKDEYTRGHSTRVAEYSRIIAQRLGYDKQFQQDMYYMGLMHDIGKLTIPDNILNKTGHLTDEEWAIIQMHTENGVKLLQNFTIIPEIKDAVLYHHERYDGKGYLAHLKGDEIPLCARIICVADSYDAMSTTRCYRLKYSRERIIQEFERCAGKQFDPIIAQIMIDILKERAI